MSNCLDAKQAMEEYINETSKDICNLILAFEKQSEVEKLTEFDIDAELKDGRIFKMSLKIPKDKK